MANEIAPLPNGADDQWMLIVGQLMQRPDFSIDQLERILALRSKEQFDRAHKAFTNDLAACQKNVTRAGKDKANPLFRSRYASIEAMYEAVWPALTEAGFAWTVSAIPTPPGWAENVVMFEGTLSKDIISKSVQLPVDRTALVPEGPRGGRPAMTVTQSIGALTTYMRKYLLGLMFNVVTAEDVAADNDGNRQLGTVPAQPPPPPPEAYGELKPPPAKEDQSLAWRNRVITEYLAAKSYEDVAAITGRIAENFRNAELKGRTDVTKPIEEAQQQALARCVPEWPGPDGPPTDQVEIEGQERLEA